MKAKIIATQDQLRSQNIHDEFNFKSGDIVEVIGEYDPRYLFQIIKNDITTLTIATEHIEIIKEQTIVDVFTTLRDVFNPNK